MSPRRLLLAYGGLVGLPLLLLVIITRTGGNLLPRAEGGPASTALSVHAVSVSTTVLILQVAVVVGVSRLAASLFRAFGQPSVVGEMCCGIMLGPSVLGWVAPDLFHSLFPPSSLSALQGLSNFGIVVYMFLIGLALNRDSVKDNGHAAVLTSHASIAVPFALGSAAALVLYPTLAPPNVGFLGFSLFLGASMSITAFPVLARILKERLMLDGTLGSLAISCAAVDDVTGWCILAYVVILNRGSQAGGLNILGTLVTLGLFITVMLTLVRPILRRLGEAACRDDGSSDGAISFLIVIPLLSAVITEYIGLHLLFGAFFAGVAMPRNQQLISSLLDKFESATVLILLPLYFALTGLRTSIGLIDGAHMWLLCSMIVVVAIVGKLGGSTLATRLTGATWHDSLTIGTLMNTRGLMELVILNVGLDIGVISDELFSMMTLMALVTTFMTTPMLAYLSRRRGVSASGLSLAAASR